ncbi:MAG: anthranilate phosphoribosyltransferase, partial [Dysgonamonadaceae bacterium]|nr:anthranilate phosphoribosyltransferase [Dysgonamonadaceae bacterium]
KGKGTSAQTNVVIANAAFAIQLIESSKSIEECIGIAKESIESKGALRSLEKFIEINSICP